VSSKISGTFQSAVQARETLSSATEKIALVDSLWTTMAMGLPVLTAARAAQADENRAACQRVAEHACADSGVLFVVETLEFMRRGGRIGGAQALLGPVETFSCPLSHVIGAHVGPGTLALNYMSSVA
jgi:fatty acid-binding protein DegV